MKWTIKFKKLIPQLTLILIFLVFIFIAIFNINSQVHAQERLFSNLSLEFLDEYELPKQNFQKTPVGGLSAISYDRQKDSFYVLSDDRSKLKPARFYTLKIDLDQTNLKQVKFKNIEVEKVTFLKNTKGINFPKNKIDPEGMAISPRGTIFISSEGNTRKRISPLIGEFNFNGDIKKIVKIPQRYKPNKKSETLSQGVQNNLGFEALTIKANGTMAQDPFRLFTATEAALTQDFNPDLPETQNRSRLLHYLINPIGEPILVGEHLYLLDKAFPGVVYNGLTELTALPQEGYLLSLERTVGLGGAGAKIFQIVIGNATDTSSFNNLQGDISNITPVKKQLLLNLNKLGISLDNLEGMTLGPRLKDGSQTLILISDDNFSEKQKNQFLLFKLS